MPKVAAGRSLKRLGRAARLAVAGTVGASVDAMFVATNFKPPDNDADRASQFAAELQEARQFFANERLFERVEGVPKFEFQALRRLREGALEQVVFQSPYVGRHPRFIKKLKSVPQTLRITARWYRHANPRPAVIVLHGWGMGKPGVDAFMLALGGLYRAGLDVLLIPAPFHGPRLPPGRTRPMFPTAHPVRACEGFAMWVADIRALAALVRRYGCPRVGCLGLSMGGYTAGLLATVDTGLDFSVPMFPFSCLPTLMWSQTMDAVASPTLDRETFIRAFDGAALLRRAPVMAPSKVHVFGARFDRVTPIDHAQRMADHLGCAYTELPASHLLQLGRGDVYRTVRALAEVS